MTDGDWSEIGRDELERRHREACKLLLASEEELARVAGALESAVRESEAAHADLAVAQADLAHAHDELRETSRLRALREDQLADVLGSASWQLTRPLRQLKSMARELEP
jgi:hypothetical protein